MNAAIPADITCADDYARRAQALLPPAVSAYIDGGNGDGVVDAEEFVAMGQHGPERGDHGHGDCGPGRGGMN